MGYLKDKHRIVVKVGSNILTYETGRLNLRRIETLVKTLSDLKNKGMQIILVSSGAVSAGVAKTACSNMPKTPEEKQVMAAIGQSELMKIYDRFFSDYGHIVAQILLTKDVLDNPARRNAAEGTFRSLLEMGVIPIVNENDPISTDELLHFGGNDILSARVAELCGADALFNLTDVDGLFDSDPRENSGAKLISRVDDIEEALKLNAGGAGTERGTGGMIAKLTAAKIATEAGVPMFILNGTDPEIFYKLLNGGHIGTYFTVSKKK